MSHDRYIDLGRDVRLERAEIAGRYARSHLLYVSTLSNPLHEARIAAHAARIQAAETEEARRYREARQQQNSQRAKAVREAREKRHGRPRS